MKQAHIFRKRGKKCIYGYAFLPHGNTYYYHTFFMKPTGQCLGKKHSLPYILSSSDSQCSYRSIANTSSFSSGGW